MKTQAQVIKPIKDLVAASPKVPCALDDKKEEAK